MSAVDLADGTRLSSDGVPAKKSSLDPREASNPVVWFVLGLVIEQPSYGYEISQRYDKRFAWLQPVSHPRIYSALAALRAARMIESARASEVPNRERQAALRHPVRATSAGKEAYTDWLSERFADDAERTWFMGRFVAAGLAGVEALLSAVDRFQRKCDDELKVLGGAREMKVDGSLDELAGQLIMDQRRRELRARRDWAARAGATLEAHAQGAASAPSVSQARRARRSKPARRK